MNVISPNLPVYVPPGVAPAGPPSVRSPDSDGFDATSSASARGKPVGAQDDAGPAEDPRGVNSSERSSATEQGLSEEELRQLTELKARDREVRAHEAAHQAAGGQYAGAVSYTYQRGPDGAQYAVGGEVSIDIAPVQGNPQATIEKMRVVRSAAMAPAEPSGQDRAVAAEAMQVMLQAQSELAAEQAETASTEPNAERGDQDGSQSRSGQQARDTYQSVADMSADMLEQQSGFRPVAA